MATNRTTPWWERLGMVAIIGTVIAAAISVVGDIQVEKLRAENAERMEQMRIESEANLRLITVRQQYLSEINSLYNDFRYQWMNLAADNTPPLDQASIQKVLENVSHQDQRLQELIGTGLTESASVDTYRQHLLDFRNELRNSTDPGDLRKAWELVATLEEDLGNLRLVLSSTQVDQG